MLKQLRENAGPFFFLIVLAGLYVLLMWRCTVLEADNNGLRHTNNELKRQLCEYQEEKDKYLIDIYKLMEQQNETLYINMDTLVRVFHYVKPHKTPVKGCPECYKIKSGQLIPKGKAEKLEDFDSPE